MEKSLVSVIVPAYNMQDYIAETLRSVLASDSPQLEVIVVDDGSTDATADVVRRFCEADERVRLLEQSNGGACRARNLGISESRGEYVLPVDADDLISPSYIRLAAEILDTQPAVKAVFCQGAFFGEREGLWRVPDFSRHLLQPTMAAPSSHSIAAPTGSVWAATARRCRLVRTGSSGLTC